MTVISCDIGVVLQVTGTVQLDIWRCRQYVGFTVDSMRIQKDWPLHPNVCVAKLPVEYAVLQLSALSIQFFVCAFPYSQGQ